MQSVLITLLPLTTPHPPHGFPICVFCKQGELEKLNQSTDDINRWESELEVRPNNNSHHSSS